MIRRLILAAALLLPLGALAQTAEDLKNDQATPGDVLTLGMGHNLQRYSPLDQINKQTVKRLVPVWNYSLGDNRGQEAQPLVHNGVMYVTTHDQTVAIDAMTGRQIWKNKIEYPEETPRVVCCGIVNRGAAIQDGKLFRTTLDNFVMAIDAKTGETLWRSQAASIEDGHSQTVAPLVANGVVITGISGGEYGIRGFIDGWDPETGRHLWRRYTVAGPGEKGAETWPGDTWKHGGAPTWITGSYDPELDLVYWGTGNGGPWNAEFRKGDNLYICSVIAVRPKTGEIVWHFQFSPNDPWDYDATAENILADMEIDGQMRKVLIQVNRNGYLYVLDRTDGELLRVSQYVTVTWADGIDMKTGRPIESAIAKKMRETGEAVEVWPSVFGGKNWFPAAYSPKSKLVYTNTLELGMIYKPAEPVYTKGAIYFGIDFGAFKWIFKEGQPHAHLKALDPVTGKAKWETPLDMAHWSGTLVTGGDLVFTGAQTGEFLAYDADTGEKVWQFQTGSGIIGQPITWEAGGKQYVTILSGIGAAFHNYIPLFANLPEVPEKLGKIPPGGSVWTFALMNE